MTTRTHPAVSEYLTRTQAALADLPAAEVEEILQDIGPHLAEIAGELGEDVSVDALTGRLGTPEQYAAELRAAAGYPPVGPRQGMAGTLVPRVALWGLVISMAAAFLAGIVVPGMRGGSSRDDILLLALPLLAAVVLVFPGARLAGVADLPEYRFGKRLLTDLPSRWTGYLRSLRPAWLLLRAVVLAAGVVFGLRVDRAQLVVMSLIGLAVLVLIGTKARTDRRLLFAAAPVNAFAAGLALALAVMAWTIADGGAYRNAGNDTGRPGLYHDDRYVSNIYAFGPDGKPLAEVYLYDQDGRPINVPSESCGSNGFETGNRFPHPRIEYDARGCRSVSGVPFAVAIPNPTPPSSAGPTTSPPTATTAPETTTTGK